MCMRNTVANVELLSPIVEAFAQCTFSLHTTRNVDVFSLCAVVEESVSSSPAARTAPATPTHQRGSSSGLHVGSKRRDPITQ